MLFPCSTAPPSDSFMKFSTSCGLKVRSISVFDYSYDVVILTAGPDVPLGPCLPCENHLK